MKKHAVPELDEAIINGRSLASQGSINDLTAADEQLRNLAEAIGGGTTPNGQSQLGQGDLTTSML